MKRRVLSVLLVIILIIGFSVPAFAATYTDLTNHWAKQYLEKLAAEGYLTGYSDGTMRPENNITTLEALTVLSRMYSLTALETEMIQSDYEATVKGLVAPNLSWGYKNIEICLASGIITLDELKSSSLTGAIQKEKLSLYLVRAMQLSSQAAMLGASSLTFTDAGKISAACAGSVAELLTLGIVKGDSSNSFSPQSSVTRAVVATMISRSLDYLKASNKTLTIEAYSGTFRQEGIISAVGDGSMEVCGFNGLAREYTVSSDAKVTVNGANMAISSKYVGCAAKVTEKNGVVAILNIDYDSTVTWVQGAVTSASSTTSSNLLYIKTKVGGKALSYTIPSAAAITRNDATVAFSTLVTGDFVTIKLVGGAATVLKAAPASVELKGTVTSISYGTTIKFRVSDANGSDFIFLLDISALPVLKRGDKIISIDQFKAGNTVSVYIAGGSVTSIVAAGTGKTVSGALTAISTTIDGTEWMITANGVATMYHVDDYVSVYNGVTAISLSDIHVGDQVSVIVYDDTITDVSLISTANSSTKVAGTVLKVDSVSQIMTLLTSANKLVSIKTSYVVSVIAASTGNTISLSLITVGSKLTVYGSYTDSRTFTAKSIIVE